MKLDSAFCFPESRPRKQRKAKVDCCSIQRIDGGVQIHTQIGVRVQRASDIDERAREIGIDSPVSTLVCFGKRGASYWPTEPTVIELAALCDQANFDVPKTLAIGELGE